MFYGRGEPDWMIESQREAEPIERRGCVRQIRTRASYRSDPNVHTPAASTDGLMAHTRSIASLDRSNYPATPTATRAAHVTHSPSPRNASTFTISIPVSCISSSSNIHISWLTSDGIWYSSSMYIYDRSIWTNTLLYCGVALLPSTVLGAKRLISVKFVVLSADCGIYGANVL